LKGLLLVAAVLAILVGAAAVFLVQPLAGAGPPFEGPRADPERLSRLVRSLVALGPRHNAAGQASAAQWIRRELEELGSLPAAQQYEAAGALYQNLIVSLGPQTPQRLVIGAHYDARGPYPGADDNASGTAALLELARMLRGATLPLRTELVFYSNEEYGLLGSRHHARSLAPGAVRAMISLEMLGCFSGPQKFPFAPLKLLYPPGGDYIVVVGLPQDAGLVRAVKRAVQGAGAPVQSINAPAAIPGIGSSDHRSYWEAGVPAAMVTDTAWYRNPRYHTASDTPDTLDYRSMAKVVDGVAGWISNVPR